MAFKNLYLSINYISNSIFKKRNHSKLKIAYGQPDKVEFSETRNRFYIYSSKKYNITCVRKFEINPNNVVIGFSSKNCF